MRAVLLLLLNASTLLMAQSPGTFTAAGNMTNARSQHTATLLGAELYDPATGAFAATLGMRV
jgi:hypothetical protein